MAIDALYELMSRGRADSGPLNVMDEDADKCCRKAFALVGHAESIGRFSCPQCGTDFHRETIGELQYWRIVPQVVIVRPR